MTCCDLLIDLDDLDGLLDFDDLDDLNGGWIGVAGVLCSVGFDGKREGWRMELSSQAI